jgi:hypothetical protein
MLELTEGLLAGCGGEFLASCWLACLKVNTGDARISDLFYWPGSYFGSGDNRRASSASDILAIALRAGRHGGR